MSDEMREEAERRVLEVRGSHDAPGFDACVDAEILRLEKGGDAALFVKFAKWCVDNGYDDTHSRADAIRAELFRPFSGGYQAALASKPQVTEEELVELLREHGMQADSCHEEQASALLQQLEMRWK